MAGPGQNAARRDMIAALLIMGALIAFVGGRRLLRVLAPRPSEQQCVALLDRYIEQASLQRRPGVDDVDIAAAQEKARTQPSYLADIASCRRELSEGQVECGLRSPNVDEMERCFQ